MSRPTLSEMKDWARQAGAILREGYGKRHQIDHKGRIDLVTEMDKKSEDYLLGQIHTRYPEHMIFAEESGQISGQEDYCWYIDPLDGTTNYAHAMPIFAVSMAYAEKGQLLLGVVYDPMRDECFSAECGAGAWLNGEPIHVSNAEDLLHSLMVTGFPYDAEMSIRNLDYFSHFTRISQGVRRFGSAALDLCYIASGRVDGYWEAMLKPWDCAAGALIVEEAGGRVTSLDGDENFMKPPFSILAAGPAIHAQMLREFQQL